MTNSITNFKDRGNLNYRFPPYFTRSKEDNIKVGDHILWNEKYICVVEKLIEGNNILRVRDEDNIDGFTTLMTDMCIKIQFLKQV